MTPPDADDMQDLLDQAVEAIAQELSSLSARLRNHRDGFPTPRHADDFRGRVDRTILAYLDLRCGCGRAATFTTGQCQPCHDALVRDDSAVVPA